MVSPWLNYEAYDIKVFNNVVHDTQGAGLGVNGGYNVLLAHNTLYRIGTRSHTLEVVYGERACDGSPATCAAYRSQGGWTRSVVHTDPDPVPNKNVYVYNNLIYNPPGVQSGSQHFAIYGPRSVNGASNIPSPAQTDVGLSMRGNVIFNGSSVMPLGIEGDDGCQSSNTSCNATQLAADNVINGSEPTLKGVSQSDYRPAAGSPLLSAQTYSIPAFPGGDRISSPLAPEGNLDNSIVSDRGGSIRAPSLVVGAYNSPDSALDAVPTPPPGSGGGSPSDPTTDTPPTIGRVSVSPNKGSVGTKVSIKAAVTDDGSLTAVAATVGKKQISLRSQRGGYGGSIRLKQRGKYKVQVTATDNGNNTTTKNGSTITII